MINANDYEASVLFRCNYASQAQVVINQGGSSAGKTYAIEQVLFCLAAEKDRQVITVVGQDIPNLKAGALRDALNLCSLSDQLKSLIKNFNKTDRVFEFHNGSIIEFKSYADAQDAKSGKRDYLFINEANGIDWNIYTELALRTRTRVFIDYNPNHEFWVHEHLIGRPGVELIISDYRHNPFIDQPTVDKIEGIKETDTERWKVYARGLTGRITGLVFTNWFVVDKIPEDAKLIGVGLDFGYSNDESGCLEVYLQNGELWIDELFYETGLTNTDLSKKLAATGVKKTNEIIADDAEPKTIEELKRMGWYVSPAKKGKDSVNNSIDILRRYKLNVTRRSVNLRKELERYKWRVDRAGKPLNQPVDTMNHLIDPLRYVALNKLKITPTSATKSKLPYKQTYAPNLNDLFKI
ncbi:terminase large subunit [Mucilaginibacter sp. dw_454]|uniref:PBSX family phage terminase large subunit n=1 Tax=Mucilaginibacter sp. dw_454 TaxID=2720079 RepID=UPI001BD3D228|nr:terminase large subunit [Mucilaginibacter sp. dw_454]